MNIKGIDIQIYNGYYYKFFNDSLWLLLFRQNSEDCIPFKDKKSAEYSTSDLKRYSILSKLNTKFKINSEYYEFILEYIVSDSTQINWWRQNDNPMTIHDTIIDENDDNYNDLKLPGFVEIQTDLNIKYWKGLAISGNGNTLLDGTPYSGDYFFAIGIVKYIEGCFIPTNINEGSKDSFLWVRCPQLSSIYSEFHTKNHLFISISCNMYSIILNSINT